MSEVDLLKRALYAQLAWDVAESSPYAEFGMEIRMPLCHYAQWARDCALLAPRPYEPCSTGSISLGTMEWVMVGREEAEALVHSMLERLVAFAAALEAA